MTDFPKVMELNQLLRFIHRAGYMRCIELSQFTKMKLATIEELVKSLLILKFIISRPLPKEAGDLYYLSSKGAAHLQEHGVKVTEVYKLDKFINDEWKCPDEWEHHLMSLGAISHLIDETSGEPLAYFFEREVRRAYPDLDKYPDGLIISSETSGLWLEIENSPKSGAKLEWMCQTIIDAYNNELPTLFGTNFRSVMVCADPESRNLNGHRINHIQRVRNKLDKMVTRDIYFHIAYMTIDHHRVLSIESGELYAERNEVEYILKRLEKVMWSPEDFFSNDKRTLGVFGNDWAGQFTPAGDGSFFWEVGIIDYDDSYNYFGPGTPSRQVEEGLDVFKSGYAKSEKACKTAIAEVLALLTLNGVTLHLIW